MKILFFTLFLLSGSQGSAFSAEPRILNVHLQAPPVDLDWNGLSTFVEAPLILNLCEGLFGYEYPSGKLVPMLAESVQKSKDLKEYTFKIRPGAKWSDGKPVYAQDFVDAWNRLTLPQSTSIYAYYLFDVLGASEFHQKTSTQQPSWSARGDFTLTVKLKRAVKDWEANTAFWPLFPVRKDQIEKYGSNWSRAGVLVSSGPFVYDSYEPGKKLVFKRNTFYTRFKSNIDEIDFYFISDQLAALKKYEEGFFLFLWGMPYSITKKHQGRDDYAVQNIMRGHLLGLNTEKFPMSNREFRKAVLSAINAKNLIPPNTNQLRPATTLIPPPLPGSETPAVMPYDPVAAKMHLKKSGIIPGKATKIKILTGLNEPDQSIGKLVQNQLIQNLGLEVELAALPSQEYTAYVNLGEYNATLLTWTAKVLNSQDFLLPYSSEANYNRMRFKNAAYDQLIYTGIQARDKAAAAQAFHRAEKLAAIDEAVLSPLFFETNSNLKRQKVNRLYFNHMGIPMLKDVEVEGIK